jgi:hypothetical protein
MVDQAVSALGPGAAVIMSAQPSAAGGAQAAGPRPAGRTQLAAYVADLLLRIRQVDFVAWIDASAEASLLAGYARAAAALGAAPAKGLEPGGFAAVAAKARVSWLVVLDAMPDLSGADYLPRRTPDSAGRVLVTTGTVADISATRVGTVLPVGMFSRRDALAYLTGRLAGVADSRYGAADLAVDLEGDPLALAQAGAYIASSGISCHDYRELLAAKLQAQNAAVSDITWWLCYQEAERLSSGVSLPALLTFCALLYGNAIPVSMFTAAEACACFDASDQQGPDRVLRALGVLEWVGLIAIDRSAAVPLIWISAAVQRAVRAIAPGGLRRQAALAAANVVARTWPADELAPWTAETYRASAVTLLREAAAVLVVPGQQHPLIATAGRSLEKAHLAGPAASWWAEVVAITDREVGPDDPGAATAARLAAEACLAAGRGAEAVAWQQRVLADAIRTDGTDHPGTIRARVGLGRALLAAGELPDGVGVLTAALRDCERVLGAQHPGTLDARDDLAAGLGAAGQHNAATQMYRGSLAERERLHGPRHPATTASRAMLAAECLADGKLKEGVKLYQRVLEDREKTLGADHPDTIRVRARLAAALQDAGKMAAAVQQSERAHADAVRVFGPDHRDTLSSAANLARACNAVGRVGDAVMLLRDTAARCGQVLPPGDPLTVSVRTSLTNLAGDG